MKIYLIWQDPVFYMGVAVFALALFLLLFSIRKYLEIANRSDFEEAGDETEEVQGELPLTVNEPELSGAARLLNPVRPDEERRTEHLNEQVPPIRDSGHGAEMASEQVLAGAAAEDPEQDPEPESEPVSEIPRARTAAAPEAETASISRAEEFVKGLYASLASLDGRVKNIETDLSKSKVNRDYSAKFLEDMVSDFDALDKAKIKARIEYLLADLKK